MQLLVSVTHRLPSLELNPLPPPFLTAEREGGREGETSPGSPNVPELSSSFFLPPQAFVRSKQLFRNVPRLCPPQTLNCPSSGLGQRPPPPLHPGPEDAAAVLGVRWGKDLPRSEGRRGAEEGAGGEEAAGPADAGALGQQEGRLRRAGGAAALRC